MFYAIPIYDRGSSTTLTEERKLMSKSTSTLSDHPPAAIFRKIFTPIYEKDRRTSVVEAELRRFESFADVREVVEYLVRHATQPKAPEEWYVREPNVPSWKNIDDSTQWPEDVPPDLFFVNIQTYRISWREFAERHPSRWNKEKASKTKDRSPNDGDPLLVRVLFFVSDPTSEFGKRLFAKFAKVKFILQRSGLRYREEILKKELRLFQRVCFHDVDGKSIPKRLLPSY